MVLILGSGRSGTTWLGKLFDSHPDVLYLHEPDAGPWRGDLPEFPGAEEIADLVPETRTHLHRIRSNRAPSVVGVPPHFPKSFRGDFQYGAYRTVLFGAKAAVRLSGRRWHGPQVPLFVSGNHQPVPVIKSVSAICRAPLYLAADEDVKIIHVIRHVNGRLASLKRGIAAGIMNPDPQLDELFALPEAGLYPFTKEEMTSRPLLEQLAWSWMVQNDKLVTDTKGNDRLRIVIYEELCRAPADMLKSLFAFAGLKESEQAAGFLAGLEAAPKEGGSYHGVALQSPLASVDRWRQDLTESEQTAIHHIVSHARTRPVQRALELD